MNSGRRDAHIVAPGHAPTPFTAAEIRLGCPAGRTIRLLVETTGEQPFVRRTRFVECDDEGAVQERSQFTMEGEPLGPVQAQRSTWAELQGHASFPVERTTISEGTLDTPLGRLECYRYTVSDGSTVDTFWFAKAKPGMPVRYTSVADGEVASVVTMIRDEYA